MVRHGHVPLTPAKAQGLAELRVHFFGSIRPLDLLQHLASCDQIDWDWYEAGMVEAYGFIPPVRELVERFRAGDLTSAGDFAQVAMFGDADAGDFGRFGAKGRLYFAGTYRDQDATQRQLLRYATGIRSDLLRNNVGYAEIRTSPHLFLLAMYARDIGGPTQRVAVSLERGDPWPLWEQTTQAALGPYGAVLTGIDLCGAEEGFPPKDNAGLFAEIKAFNAAHPERALAILYHVGESFRDKSLESAVRWVHEAAEMGAHRLGHAIALGVEPQVLGGHNRTEPVAERRDQIRYDLKPQRGLSMAGVRIDPQSLAAELGELQVRSGDDLLDISYDRLRLTEVRLRQEYAMRCIRSLGAVIEVCPTSNRRIAGILDPAQHPVHRFLASGLPFVVCSDDPGMFGTTLGHEIEWVCEQTGGGEELSRHLVDLAWRSRSECLTGRSEA